MSLLDDVDDRDEEGSIAIDADSLLYSSCYQHREDFNIELAYMNFCERIGTIRSECYNHVMKLNELLILFTSKTNFRYDIYPEYKANRGKYATEESIKLVGYTKELKKLIYQRLKPIVRVSSVWEADDIAIQLSDKGYMIGAIDKDVVNACVTKCFNYKKSEWHKARTVDEINRWYLIQSIQGDASDNLKGAKGYGEVKATKFVDELLNQERTYDDYINLFVTPEECLLMNRLVRMGQYNDKGKLKLISMKEIIDSIIPF